jgi:glucose-6-phosphate isomerase
MTLDRVDAWHVGGLLMWLQCATVYAGALYGIQPLDQPGVELGKRYTGALLGKPGADALRTEFEGLAVQEGRVVL